MQDLTGLYLGTGVMLFAALIIILLVIRSDVQIRKILNSYKERDKYYVTRLDTLEKIVKEQFKEILGVVKNIIKPL